MVKIFFQPVPKFQRELALHIILERALVSLRHSVPVLCWFSLPLLCRSFTAVSAWSRWSVPRGACRWAPAAPCASASRTHERQPRVIFQYEHLGEDDYVVTQKIAQVSSLLNSVSLS